MRKSFAWAAAALLSVSGVARAETIAYWRFEEGAADTQFTPPPTDGGAGSGLAVDQTGNNPLRTFAGFTNPTYRASVPFSSTVGGQSNTRSLQFGPSPDDETPLPNNEDLYTAGPGTLNARSFSAFTLEASFNVDNVTRYHGLVGKDGKPTASPIAPLQLKVRDDDNRLQIEILDSAGAEKQVRSINEILPGQWYSAAAVNDGTNLSLYLDSGDGAGYVLQGSVPVTGGLFASDATWTVGRGFFDNGITDWADGLIDEVRISDTALSPGQFLAVPEPSSLGLLGVAGLLALRRRR